METFRADTARRHGIPTDFVQDNHSRSRQGALRGIHFQTHPGQGKLVRVARGEVFDVVVDLRRGSETLRRVGGRAADGQPGGEMLWIPVGFGHGFLVLSETADFVYRCDELLRPGDRGGIRFDDPAVGIEWPGGVELPVASERDATARPAVRGGRTRCRSRCERALRPVPHGCPAPGQPAHGAAGVAVRALGRVGVRGAVEDLDTGRVRPGLAQEQLGDLAAIGLDWDGPVWVQS